MAVVNNIEETTATIVLDENMWMGTRDGSTAWLNGIAGTSAGQAEGGVKMCVIEVDCAAQDTDTSIDLGTTAIAGLSGTVVLALLSVINTETVAKPPLNLGHTGDTLSFKTHATAGANQLHRIVFLYA
tara:strand:- start:416 stop:799 length:384 start_codon:yes stop_codon:yes gene_type:complete